MVNSAIYTHIHSNAVYEAIQPNSEAGFTIFPPRTTIRQLSEFNFTRHEAILMDNELPPTPFAKCPLVSFQKIRAADYEVSGPIFLYRKLP